VLEGDPAAQGSPPVTGRVAERAPTRRAPDNLGRGRVATFAGSVKRNGRPTPAVVSIVGGWNGGTSVTCDAEGAFSMTGLYPGLAHLEVHADGVCCAQRSVLLRARVPATLDLDLATGAGIYGTVVGVSGTGIVGAKILGDGAVSWSSADGAFSLPRRASGAVPLRIHHPDHADTELRVTGANAGSIHLLPGGELHLAIPATRGSDEVHVYVLPVGDRVRPHPWNRRNPVAARAGTRVRIGNLPRGEVDVLVFHELGFGELRTTVGDPTEAPVVLSWRDYRMVGGSVWADGAPLVGVQVILHHEDEMAVLRALLGSARVHLRSIPFEVLPVLRQQAPTTADGAFRIAAPDVPGAGWWFELREAGHDPGWVAVPDTDGALRVEWTR